MSETPTIVVVVLVEMLFLALDSNCGYLQESVFGAVNGQNLLRAMRGIRLQMY